ncbi:MAG: glycosyltransferase family 87 protein [Dongiaceae bacterium]
MPLESNSARARGGIDAIIAWLTIWRLLIILSVVFFCAFGARTLYGYYTTSDGMFGKLGYPIGRDYVNIWTAARVTLAGKINVLPHVTQFHKEQEALLGRPFPLHNWSYPPHLIPMIVGIGLLPYFAGLAVWLAVTFAAYATSIAAGRERKLVPILIALIAPSSYMNCIGGQNGFLTAALLIGGLRLLDRYPIWAGVLFGILTIKPQLGLLVPVALLAAGAWRAIAAALVTAGMLVAGSIALFGTEPWISYVTEIMPFQRHILEKGTGLFMYMMPTPFMAARISGMGIQTGYVLNGATAVLAVAVVGWCYRNRSIAPDLRIAIFATAVFLASPYAFNYDLTIATAALIGWLAFRAAEPQRGIELVVISAMWLLPISVLSPLSVNMTELPYAPIVLVTTLIYLLARANAFSFVSSRRTPAVETFRPVLKRCGATSIAPEPRPNFDLSRELRRR